MAAQRDKPDELAPSETVGDPPGFIVAEAPGPFAGVDEWRAYLGWLRTLPPDAELREQRIIDAEQKLREFIAAAPAARQKPLGAR